MDARRHIFTVHFKHLKKIILLKETFLIIFQISFFFFNYKKNLKKQKNFFHMCYDDFLYFNSFFHNDLVCMDPNLMIIMHL